MLVKNAFSFALLLALCTAAAGQSETSLAVRSKQDDFRDGIDAVQKFVDIFNSKMFEGTPVGIFAEVASKSLTSLVSIIDLIKGKKSQNPVILELRKQFSDVHNRLDRVDFQLNHIKSLIEWSTAQAIFARHENDINYASEKYKAFLTASPEEKKSRMNDFIKSFKSIRQAAHTLHAGVVKEDQVISKSITAALKKYTKNHRRKVSSFLLAMGRLIHRGAEMEITFLTLKNSKKTAKLFAQDWTVKMKNYWRIMQSVENSVKAVWRQQMLTDANEKIAQYKSKINRDFAKLLYQFLAEKYDWQYWIVAAYKAVKGFDNHTVWAPASVLHFLGLLATEMS